MIIFLFLLVELLFIPGLLFFLSADAAVLAFIIMNVLTITVLISRQKEVSNDIIIVGFLLRLLLLGLDAQFGLLHFPDTDDFYSGGIDILYNTSDRATYDNYSHFLSFIFRIVENSYLAQYINIVFSISGLIYMSKILNMVGLSKKQSRILMLLSSCWISGLAFHPSLLREAIPFYFIALSVYNFMLWTKTSNSIKIYIAVACVFLASALHSGCLLIAVGYIMALAFYNARADKNKMSMSRLAITAIIVLSAVYALSTTDYLFASKFRAIDGEKSLAELQYNSDEGNSAYLSWIDPQNDMQVLMYSPLRMFYFLFSPLPTEWNRVMDIASFIADGGIWFLLLFYVYRKCNVSSRSKSLIIHMSFSLLLFAFVFANYTYTAGTAMRHRLKAFPLMIAMYAVVKSEEEKIRKHTTLYCL
jgi:hypothetical protein